jgi:general L-amino acid transport system permease protein
MATLASRRPVSPRTIAHARRWAHQNLFSTPANGVLTVVVGTLILFVAYQLLRFVLTEADWTVIQTNRRLLAVGRFPRDDEWRLWPPIWTLAALIGLSYGHWSRLDRVAYAVLAAVLVFAFTVLFEGRNALLMAVALALGAAGYLAVRRIPEGSALAGRAGRAIVFGWLILLPFTVALLLAAGGVRTTLWGGILLNVMLATVGIAAGFPIGVLMALGRTSSLPVVRIPATLYIELVRAGPLIAWLFLARFVLLDFMPPILTLDQLDIVVRAMIVLAAFTGAYVAEIVRGGLQGLGRGQSEAAQALGLNAYQTTTQIVLPQALRNVIPALVSQFISLWKDTTLVFALGLTDLLGAGEAAYAQLAFIGTQAEVLAFVALLFWAIAFAMSRLSRRLETRLGVGER